MKKTIGFITLFFVIAVTLFSWNCGCVFAQPEMPKVVKVSEEHSCCPESNETEEKKHSEKECCPKCQESPANSSNQIKTLDSSKTISEVLNSFSTAGFTSEAVTNPQTNFSKQRCLAHVLRADSVLSTLSLLILFQIFLI